MRIAYFDCFSGISGNMILGALLDAGLEGSQLESELARLGLGGYQLVVEPVWRKGLRGTLVDVRTAEQQAHRHLHQIETIIEGSDLPAEVKSTSLTIFHRLAQAEAKVHGKPVESIHFHEVGALDAIVDVVGSVVGLWLLGVEGVFASHVHIGRGTVECQHGVIPVPAPATAELLCGVPTYGRDVDAELVTPTGAAILTTLAKGYGAAPPMRVDQIGYGAGNRELPQSNLLRVSIGTTVDEWNGYEQDVVTVLETNIDDMNPQLYEYLLERLFAIGALDVFLTPIQMKRNRPGTLISILVTEDKLGDALDVLFAETTTIGVRTRPLYRWKLARESVAVKTVYGSIEVKVSRKGGQVMTVSPEYRDCKSAAERHGVPLKVVQQAASEAARRHLDRPKS
jgi:uncharacterized protein (TIGR00299 family) protein